MLLRQILEIVIPFLLRIAFDVDATTGHLLIDGDTYGTISNILASHVITRQS